MFLELSTELLAEGYGVRFRAGGNSMHPTIRDGEAVKVEPVSALEIRRGDIILYSAGRGLTAHRVVRVDESNDGARVFHLRGDACASLDEPVAAEQTIGRVTEVERGGRLIAFAWLAARIEKKGRIIVAKHKKT